jgi:hypothetical protein
VPFPGSIDEGFARENQDSPLDVVNKFKIQGQSKRRSQGCRACACS